MIIDITGALVILRIQYEDAETQFKGASDVNVDTDK